jgi:hypothetical protein
MRSWVMLLHKRRDQLTTRYWLLRHQINRAVREFGR